MNLETELKEYIRSENLCVPKDRLLVAVSGGVDSVVLVHLLHGLGYDISLVHVNFQLRGKDSDLDEIFVKNLSDQIKAPFFITRFETESYAKINGISTQMAARKLRYQWFAELQQAHGFHRIVTAHHLNDVLETILLNLTKGTGIAGLHGILPKRGLLIRPLLFAEKKRLIAYANSNQLSWREDESNANQYYQRNLIRNEVIPILKKINPNIEATTRDTVEILRSVEKQYQETIDQLRERLLKADGEHIRLSKTALSDMERPVFADIIRLYGFNFEQCRSILNARQHTGKIFQSPSHTLNIDRDDLIISPNTENEYTLKLDNHLSLVEVNHQKWNLTRHSAEEYTISDESTIAALDVDKLSFPMKIRKWQPGDRFYPLGMKHFKKISDFLVDAKVPLNYKASILVLVSGDDIVWVIGHRIDERYKVTKETRTVLEIRTGA